MIIAFTGAGISKDSGIPTFEDIEANENPDEIGIRDKLSRSFANRNPEIYQETIDSMVEGFKNAKPNDAHLALAEYKIPIMTMNIDGLHEKAGSEHVINMHGTLPNIVLYEDPAPNYQKALDWIFRLGPSDVLLIIGTSFYTNISNEIKICARGQGARIVIINDKASEYVRTFLERNKGIIEDFDEFMKREESY